MADITMCLSKTCPIKKFCYRATAKPDKHWQSVSVFKPELRAMGISCEGFEVNDKAKKLFWNGATK